MKNKYSLLSLLIVVLILQSCKKEDKIAPVFTLTGSDAITVTLNSSYTDEGATATDDVDGDITAKISMTSTVNTGVVGSYNVTFTVSDKAGNTATKTRNVSVSATGTAPTTDTTPPVITLTTNDTTYVSLNSTFSDPGATAQDNKDGDISAKISVSGATSVNKDLVGTYDVVYTVTDLAGNSASATRKVVVRNDAYIYAGVFAITQEAPQGSSLKYYYDQTVTVSTTINNKISFSLFSGYSNNTTIYATASGNSLTIPLQTASNIGSPSKDHTFEGTGSKLSTGFTLNFSDKTSTSIVYVYENHVKK